jgi:hypothetical protein
MRSWSAAAADGFAFTMFGEERVRRQHLAVERAPRRQDEARIFLNSISRLPVDDRLTAQAVEQVARTHRDGRAAVASWGVWPDCRWGNGSRLPQAERAGGRCG